jgi:hypothetical protein
MNQKDYKKIIFNSEVSLVIIWIVYFVTSLFATDTTYFLLFNIFTSLLLVGAIVLSLNKMGLWKK